MKRSRILYLILFLFVFTNANGQGWLKKLGNKVVDKVEKKTEKKTDQVIDNELNKGQKPANKSDNKNKGTENVAAESSEKGKLESYTHYDFVPGDRILYFEDFSQDAIGDFPALWTTDVAGEVNTLNVGSGHWFNLNSGEGTYWYMKDIDFPTNFILEMDIVPKTTATRIAADLVIFGENNHSEMDKEGNPGTCGLHILMEKANWSTKGYKKGSNEYLTGASSVNPVEAGKVNHVIVWVQNRRVRIYQKGAKVLDIPTNLYEGSKFKRLCFKLYRGASCGSYISNIKITTASPDTRSKLLTEGKLVSYGIYFDVNKDIVKPESYGSIKEIATVLNENPTVKIKVTGHTDSDGDDALNMDLSKRRAANVKQYLINEFKVDGSRIETDGKGESQPIATNNSVENKAKNRRVEFTKL